MREVILDCETTGLDAESGHRIVELAAVELDGVRIGRRWHSFFNPCRDVDPAAVDVHGLTNEKLKNEPKFEEMVDDLIEFLKGATLIAHNSNFDKSFIAMEMWRAGHVNWRADWIDTLPLARKKVPRKGHSLDALCKHFGIRKTKRAVHGAILDTILLAEVYARLVGRLDQLELNGMKGEECVWLRGGELLILAECNIPNQGSRPEKLTSRLTMEELLAHKNFMEQLKKDHAHAIARANSD